MRTAAEIFTNANGLPLKECIHDLLNIYVADSTANRFYTNACHANIVNLFTLLPTRHAAAIKVGVLIEIICYLPIPRHLMRLQFHQIN
jgi:hypothetical protein